MRSRDLTERNIERIAELFPTVVTETRGANGELVRAIDFDRLRQELSGEIVDGRRERYQLDWPGKREAMLAANAPIAKTLRPVRDESVDFETTQNLFVEGDNLDALKLLQESYLGKVKLIFIDPPYNTGNDFIYNDDFATTREDYLSASGQVDDAGSRLTANTATNGRFHSAWLTMIYPRLKLSRSLLSDDGVLFVSIGDDEVASLRFVLDEIYGEHNFVASIIWQSRTSISDDLEVSPNHNYVLVYARDRERLTFWGEELRSDEYANPDDDPRGPWKLVPLDANKPGGDTQYEVVNPETGEGFWPPDGRSWAINSASMDALIADGRVKFGLRGTSAPKKKLFLRERIARGDTRTPSSLLLDAGTTKDGSREIERIFGTKRMFDYPKPVSLLRRLVRYGSMGAKDGIVLDFFAGSGSTAQAVLEENAADGGTRRFIVVQVPEPTGPATQAAKAGYASIADLAKERIRRSRPAVDGSTGAGRDVGFRVLKVDSGNVADVLRTADSLRQEELRLDVPSIKPDRTGDDLVFQVLLDWGLDLSLPIRSEQAGGHELLTVGDGALIACFDPAVTLDVVREIARREPLRAVFRDGGFASDADRINAEQVFREISPSTDVKVI